MTAEYFVFSHWTPEGINHTVYYRDNTGHAVTVDYLLDSAEVAQELASRLTTEAAANLGVEPTKEQP
jgi:hypothetical protein